jgi:hypothetical protein
MVVAVGELGAWIARQTHDDAGQTHGLGFLFCVF